MPDLTAGYKAVEALQSLQTCCVVLTLGEKGVLFSERISNDQWGAIQHIQAERVEAVDTTVIVLTYSIFPSPMSTSPRHIHVVIQTGKYSVTYDIIDCSIYNLVLIITVQGAGDAFVGALAYYLACGKDKDLTLAEMLKRSGVVASCTVLGRGTQSSYCTERLPRDLLL